MTRARQLVESGTGSFIYELRGALEAAVCSNMMHRFETCTEHQHQGRIGQGEAEQPDIKRSTDLRVSGRPEWRDIDKILFNSLGEALNLLSVSHPFFASNPFRDMGYNLQRTRPGEFYH